MNIHRQRATSWADVMGKRIGLRLLVMKQVIVGDMNQLDVDVTSTVWPTLEHGLGTSKADPINPKYGG